MFKKMKNKRENKLTFGTGEPFPITISLRLSWEQFDACQCYANQVIPELHLNTTIFVSTKRT